MDERQDGRGTARRAATPAQPTAEPSPAPVPAPPAVPAPVSLPVSLPASPPAPVPGSEHVPASTSAPSGQQPIDPRLQALDPRSIARASLQASRNASLWWTSAGIVLAVLVALVVSTRAGAFVLAAVCAAGAVVRAVRPSPGPVAVSVRSRPVDVLVLAALASGIAVLAQVLPAGSR